MSSRIYTALVLGVGSLIAATAPIAQVAGAEHPPFVPTRDVSITYQIQADGMPGGAGSQTVRVSYSTTAARARIERNEGPGYLIVDRAAGHAMMVMEPLQSYLEVPFDDRTGAGMLLDDRMRYTRGGTDHIAGLACTQWDIASDTTKARLCITNDGVILAGEGQDTRRGAGRMTATQVSYAALPASMFTPPASFRRLEIPAGATQPKHPPG